MDITQESISLHPDVLNRLFAYKSKTRTVFSDVLGLHEINHIAIAYISKHNILQTLSSTPSLEYNLLSSPLWRFDRAYHPDWFKKCEYAGWQSLYSPQRYDELYYLKQTKPRYPLGLAMAATLCEGHVIYSVASHKDSEYTHEIFKTQRNELYQLGQYCSNLLLPLLLEADETTSSLLQTHMIGTL